MNDVPMDVSAIEAMVSDLRIGPPGDADAVLKAVGRRRGRPIKLIGGALDPDQPCGLWIATKTADWVVFDRRMPMALQQQTKLHEAAHILRGHAGVPLSQLIASRRKLRLQAEAVALMLVGEDPEATVLCRDMDDSGYADRNEAEAEAVATMLAGITQQAQRDGTWSVRQGAEDRIAKAAASLERRRGKWGA